MVFCTHRFTSLSGSGRSLRATAAVLLLAYFALAGEAIHCQYFLPAHSQHAEHSTDPVPTTDHTIHCLVANHAGSVAVNSNGSSPLPAPAPTLYVLPDEGLSLVSSLTRLTPARAPPTS